MAARPPGLTRAATAGLTAALTAVSYASLVYTGPLADLLPAGLAASLLGMVVLASVGALASPYPGTIIVVANAPVAFLAVTVPEIGRIVADPVQAQATALAAILLVAGGLGLLFLTVGALRLGQIGAMIPHPVIGGFFGAVGVVLMDAGLAMVRVSLLAGDWAPARGLDLGFTVALVAGMWAVSAQGTRPGGLVLAIVAGALVYHGVCLALGVAPTVVGDLIGGGAAQGAMPWAPAAQAWSAVASGAVDGTALLASAPALAAAGLVSAVNVMMNMALMERDARTDLSPDRELRAAGLANLAAAGLGALPGYHSSALHRITARPHGIGRAGAAGVAAACLATLAVAGPVLGTIPIVVAAAIPIWIGLDLLWQWLVTDRARMPWQDYGIVLVIVALTITQGPLIGISAGVVIGLVRFLVGYARLPVIAYTREGANLYSTVGRPAREAALLRDNGHRILVIGLQNTLFFGSFHRLYDRIRARLDGAAGPDMVILDLERLQAIDHSASMGLDKLRHRATARGVDVAVCGASPAVAQVLGRARLCRDDVEGPVAAGFAQFTDVDRALEWAEGRVLARLRPTHPGPGPDKDGFLDGFAADATARKTLCQVLVRQRVSPGAPLITQGDAGDALYFIEDGWLDVVLDGPDGRRLRRTGPGAVVGEVAFYTGAVRSASVIARTDAVVHRLTGDALARLEASHPDIAHAVHKAMIRMLAGRLADTNRVIDTLLKR